MVSSVELNSFIIANAPSGAGFNAYPESPPITKSKYLLMSSFERICLAGCSFLLVHTPRTKPLEASAMDNDVGFVVSTSPLPFVLNLLLTNQIFGVVFVKE